MNILLPSGCDRAEESDHLHWSYFFIEERQSDVTIYIGKEKKGFISEGQQSTGSWGGEARAVVSKEM